MHRTTKHVFIFISTNLPKEIMGYPDFPIPAQEKSYIPAKDMLAFLQLYAKTFGVQQCVKFQHYVIRVRPVGESRWEVHFDIDTRLFHQVSS